MRFLVKKRVMEEEECVREGCKGRLGFFFPLPYNPRRRRCHILINRTRTPHISNPSIIFNRTLCFLFFQLFCRCWILLTVSCQVCHSRKRMHSCVRYQTWCLVVSSVHSSCWERTAPAATRDASSEPRWPSSRMH